MHLIVGNCESATVMNISVLVCMAGQQLGIPFAPVFLDPATKGRAILRGVNYASGGSGILDFTGYNFVRALKMPIRLIDN